MAFYKENPASPSLAKAEPLVALMLQTTKTPSLHGLNLLAALSSHALGLLAVCNQVILSDKYKKTS